MYKFKGAEGEFLMGVPAHDLSDDDVAALTAEQKDILDGHMKTDKPIYELVADAEQDAAPPAKAKGPESVDRKAGGR